MANLKELYIFQWFDDEFLSNVVKASKTLTFKAGETVLEEGSMSNDAHILLKGIVSVYIKGKNVNTIFEWDIFWEIWLVMDEPRTATIKAETDIETLEINKKTLGEILKRTPDGDYIRNTILNRIIQNNKNLR